MMSASAQPASTDPQPAPPSPERLTIGFFYGMPTHPPTAGAAVHGYQLVRNLLQRGHRLCSWYSFHDDIPECTYYRGRHLGRFLNAIDVLYLRVGLDTKMVRRSCMKWLRRQPLPVVWELNGLPQELLYQGGSGRQVDRVTAGLRRYAGLADAAIGVTDRIGTYLRDEVGIARVRVIPNGSDPESFAPAQSSRKGPLRVAWVGASRFGWHDLDTLLEAAKHLAAQNAPVVFTIFGRREHLPETLPPNVQCSGEVPYAELGRHLGRMDVGIHLFRRSPGVGTIDGSPLKLFDYMASGLAVVAQDQGQVGQILRTRQAGMVTTGNSRDLARVLLHLHKNRDQCRQFGANGRSAVLERYNWQQVAADTEKLLHETIQACAKAREGAKA